MLDPKFHHWLINAFDLRIQEDYDAETLLTSEHVEDVLEQARAFLAAAQEFLQREGGIESPP